MRVHDLLILHSHLNVSEHSLSFFSNPHSPSHTGTHAQTHSHVRARAHTHTHTCTNIYLFTYKKSSEISGSQGSEYEDDCLLGCHSMYCSLVEVNQHIRGAYCLHYHELPCSWVEIYWFLRCLLPLLSRRFLMEIVSTSEMLVNIHQNTKHKIAEDSLLYKRRLFQWDPLVALLVNMVSHRWSYGRVHDTPAVSHMLWNRVGTLRK
jgi:hypothetical protein